MDTRETVGYLCRWCLLTVCVAGVLASSVAVVRATAGIADRGSGSIIVSDALWNGRGPFDQRLFGCIEPALSDWDVQYVLVRDASHRVSLEHLWRIGLRVQVPNPVAGRSRIVILPIPYSCHAFEKWSIQLLSLTGSDTVYLIDARMAPSDEPAPPELPKLLDDLRRRGLVVFIGTGTGEKFAALRRGVNQVDPQAMLVCTCRWANRAVLPDLNRSTRKVFNLDESGLRNVRHLAVITNDPAWARQVTAKKIQTHLVGQNQNGPAAPSDYLTPHETIADLREYLSWQPTD